MRVLDTVVHLAFTDSVHSGGEVGAVTAAAAAAAQRAGERGQNVGLANLCPPKLVPCRIALFASAISSALVAHLPRLGQTLVRLHYALHPGLVLLNGAGDSGGQPVGGKRKSKKKSKGNGNAAGSRLSVDSFTRGEEDGVGGSVSCGGESSGRFFVEGGGLPLRGVADTTTTETPPPAVPLIGGSHVGGDAAATSISLSPNATLKQAPSNITSSPSLLNNCPPSSPGVYFSQASETPGALLYAHPGHKSYTQFGSYRLSAVSILAALASRDNAVISEVLSEGKALGDPTAELAFTAAPLGPQETLEGGKTPLDGECQTVVSEVLAASKSGEAAQSDTITSASHGGGEVGSAGSKVDDELLLEASTKVKRGGKKGGKSGKRRSNGSKGRDRLSSEGSDDAIPHYDSGSDGSGIPEDSLTPPPASLSTTNTLKNSASKAASRAGRAVRGVVRSIMGNKFIGDEEEGRNFVGDEANSPTSKNNQHSNFLGGFLSTQAHSSIPFQPHSKTNSIKVSLAALDALSTGAALGCHAKNTNLSAAGTLDDTTALETISPLPSLKESSAAATTIDLVPSLTTSTAPIPTAEAACSTQHHQSSANNFSPGELWSILAHWVLLYPHTNMYHVAFLSLLKGTLKARHEGSLTHILRTGKLVTCFINHYISTTPPKNPSLLPRQSSTPRPPSSSARGSILLILNSLRCAAPYFPPTSILPSHLRDHSQWLSFAPRLIEDTLLSLAPPAFPPPPASRPVAMHGIGAGGFLQNLFGRLPGRMKLDGEQHSSPTSQPVSLLPSHNSPSLSPAHEMTLLKMLGLESLYTPPPLPQSPPTAVKSKLLLPLKGSPGGTRSGTDAAQGGGGGEVYRQRTASKGTKNSLVNSGLPDDTLSNTPFKVPTSVSTGLSKDLDELD